MKVCTTIQEIRQELSGLRHSHKIGLVPTMGALHNGHLSLVRSCKTSTEVCVASIFVNPAQFNNAEDLEKYPRTAEKDAELLSSVGCDFLFLPNANEIYPEKPEATIDLGTITKELEGKFRPGHFNGVSLVVSKLFNIIQPHEAFFGQKDLQQFYVIQKLIEQLNFNIGLNMVQTEREANGLAMSSRNQRLSRADREEASLIHQSLQSAKAELSSSLSIHSAKQLVRELFGGSNRFTLEYFEVVDTSNFKPLEKIENKEKVAMCIAAEIGGVRLIDNLLLIS